MAQHRDHQNRRKVLDLKPKTTGEINGPIKRTRGAIGVDLIGLCLNLAYLGLLIMAQLRLNPIWAFL
jgi:hypothetical protein